MEQSKILLQATINAQIELLNFQEGEQRNIEIILTNTGNINWPKNTKLYRVPSLEIEGLPDVYDLPQEIVAPDQIVTIKVDILAPMQLGQNFVAFKLQENNDQGEILYLPINVEQFQFQELQNYDAIIVAQNTNLIQAKSDEEIQIKFKLRNTGKECWPINTKLYEVGNPYHNFFIDNETHLEIGSIKQGSFKVVDFDINAPKKLGSYKLEFRFGLGPKGTFFGPIAKFTIDVVE